MAMKKNLAAIMAGLIFATASTGAALADWRKELGTFRVGVVGGDDPASESARIEPFRVALEDALKVNVEIFPANGYPALIDALAAGRIEYAVMSASAYAAAWVKCECVDPLVSAMGTDGSKSFYSVVIARKGGVASLAGLEHKKLVALARNSLGGYALAAQELAKEGFSFKKKGVELEFPASPDQAIADFEAGKADAMIGWTTLVGNEAMGYSAGTLRDLGGRDGKEAKNYAVLWKSQPVPYSTHVIRKNLDGEAKKILHDLLINLASSDTVAYDSIEPTHGGGFTEVQRKAYLPLIDFVRNPEGNGFTASPKSGYVKDDLASSPRPVTSPVTGPVTSDIPSRVHEKDAAPRSRPGQNRIREQEADPKPTASTPDKRH